MAFDPDNRNDIQRAYNARVHQQALDYERAYHRSLADARNTARLNALSSALCGNAASAADPWDGRLRPRSGAARCARPVADGEELI